MLARKEFLTTCPLFLFISWLALLLHIGPHFDFLTIIIGLISLLGFMVFTGILDSFLPNPWRVFFRLGLIVLVVLNAENVLINGSHIDLSFSHFAFNRSFILGTLLNLRMLALLLFFSTFFMVALLFSRKVVLKLPLLVPVVLCLLLFGADLLVPEQVQYSSWLQKNIITFNVKNHLHFSDKGLKGSLENSFVKDLSGRLRTDLVLPEGKRPNIVLLILEGFSEDYVQQGLTPNLKRFLEENLHFPHFLSNQVQTNRGLYALLCNDYPNIGSAEAKADLISTFGPKRPCLPQILKEQGYSTLFLQSAPLEFMRKDLFAKASGFEFAGGATSFDPEKIISEWGVSDGTLLEGALNVLSSEEFKRPLFLTLLTVSTHHPYITPESKNDLLKAIAYTDKVFGDFYQILKNDRFFENNLLIVTSDEARPSRNVDSIIMTHWSVLGMAGQGIPKGTSPEMFSQVDVAMTIADYLGFQEKAEFRGRSLLRNYDTGRDIYTGSAFLKRPMLIKDEKTIHICDQSFACIVAEYNRSIFDLAEKPRISPSNKADFMRAFIRNSDLTFESYHFDRLFAEKDFTFRTAKQVLGEFKTPAGMTHLKYHIVVDDFPKSGDLRLSYFFYPCGVPGGVISKSESIKLPEKYIDLNVPSELKDKTLCHSATLETGSDGIIKVEQFEFLKGGEK